MSTLLWLLKMLSGVELQTRFWQGWTWQSDIIPSHLVLDNGDNEDDDNGNPS